MSCQATQSRSKYNSQLARSVKMPYEYLMRRCNGARVSLHMSSDIATPIAPPTGCGFHPAPYATLSKIDCRVSKIDCRVPKIDYHVSKIDYRVSKTNCRFSKITCQLRLIIVFLESIVVFFTKIVLRIDCRRSGSIIDFSPKSIYTKIAILCTMLSRVGVYFL